MIYYCKILFFESSLEYKRYYSTLLSIINNESLKNRYINIENELLECFPLICSCKSSNIFYPIKNHYLFFSMYYYEIIHQYYSDHSCTNRLTESKYITILIKS